MKTMRTKEFKATIRSGCPNSDIKIEDGHVDYKCKAENARIRNGKCTQYK